MAEEGDQESQGGDALRDKMLAICEFMIGRVYGMTVDEQKKLTPDQLKSLMFVVREAWYLSNDRFGEITLEEFEKLQAMAQDDDDETALESDEEEGEEDDDPFGLRD